MAVSISDFSADGFLVVRNAVAPDIVRACVKVIEEELHTRGVDPHGPATWITPVVPRRASVCRRGDGAGALGSV